MAIPLFDPASPLRPLRAELRAAVHRVLDSGSFVLGEEVAGFECEFAAYLGSGHAIGVANGTEALTIALRALGVGAGDDVVVPSFTFWASAEAIPPTGARPIFCDIDPTTYLVTPDTVRAALTPKTKAVIVPHLFGNVADISAIEALGVPVVEDAAQAAGSIGENGARPGAIGTIATFSFYPSKNLGAFGDGGAITSDDPELAETVRALRFHGSRDKVDYQLVGYNSRLDEIQAAVLRVQLPQLDAWAEHRHAAGRRYAELLDGVVTVPAATAGSRPAWHLYVIAHPEADRLHNELVAREIGARPYYRTPIHAQQPMRGFAPADPASALPGTLEAARSHLAIPISAAITPEQQDEVVSRIKAAVGSAT